MISTLLLRYARSRDRADLHEFRVRKLLRCGATFFIAVTGAWLVLYLAAGHLAAAGMCGFGGACGVFVLLMERGNRLRTASWTMLVVAFALVFLSAAFLDVPSDGGDRAVHECFIPLAVGAYLVMRDLPWWVRHGAAVACLLAFAYFAGFEPRWHTTFEVPDPLRSIGDRLNLGIALVALYIVIFVTQLDIDERHSLDGAIRDALIRDEMSLFFQAQMTEDGRVVGAEALLRWDHPERGWVSPGEFIPVAEAAGLMPMLGEWVLRRACAELATWQSVPALSELRLAVNVSASQFTAPDFEKKVVTILAASGVRPERLKIELTESTLARDVDAVVAVMKSLRAQGVEFSLDDFGTGFSSLSYLRRLPLSQLKIDQSFVRQMTASEVDIAGASGFLCVRRVTAGRHRKNFRQADGHLKSWAC